MTAFKGEEMHRGQLRFSLNNTIISLNKNTIDDGHFTSVYVFPLVHDIAKK